MPERHVRFYRHPPIFEMNSVSEVGVLVQPGNRFVCCVAFGPCARFRGWAAEAPEIFRRIASRARRVPVACPSPVCWLVVLNQVNSSLIHVRSC